MGRKGWIPAFSLFPPMFSKSFFLRVVNSRDHLGKGQTFYLDEAVPFFNSTGQRPASYCHGIVSVIRLFVCPCVCKLCLPKTSPQKLLTGFLPNITGMIHRWSSFKFLQIIVFHEEFWLP